jgi:nucleotide-binding universal stress UspA family protein
MYKNIVVGTDGSETADIAVQHATALARSSGATLHVVHAYQAVSVNVAALSASSGGPVVDLEPLNAAIDDNAQSVCARAVASCGDAGLSVQSHTVNADPATALINVAEAVDADLLVVGNRGMSGVKRFVLGSVPNKVAHHAPCNLLIVNTSL